MNIHSTTPTVMVRALRNVGVGMGRDMLAEETGEVNAVDAQYLLAIGAVALVDPADAERVAAAALRYHTDEQFKLARQ